MYYSIFIFFHKLKLTYFWFYFVFLFPAFTRCWSLDVFCLNWKNLKPAAHRLVWYPVRWDCRQWLLRSLRWHRQKELTQCRASVWPLPATLYGQNTFLSSLPAVLEKLEVRPSMGISVSLSTPQGAVYDLDI